MATRRNIQYSNLPSEEADGDLRFTYTPKSHMRIPWKAMALALFLLIIGILLLSLSYFIFTNHMEGDGSQAYGLLFLGVLAFLPGYYKTRVAYYSWRGAQGYTFASIPDYQPFMFLQAPGQLIEPLTELSKLSRLPSDMYSQHIF